MRIPSPCCVKEVQRPATMKVFVLALCLALVVGDHDTASEADEYCKLVTIFLNPVIRNCQTLKQASETVG